MQFKQNGSVQVPEARYRRFETKNNYATGEDRNRRACHHPSMAAMTSIGWIQVSTPELIEEIRSYERKKSTAYISVSGFAQFH